MLFALAILIILDHRPTAGQNVPSMPNVLSNKRAINLNVEIHARELVALMPIVKLLTITRFAVVPQDTLAIHLLDVMCNPKMTSLHLQDLLILAFHRLVD